MGVDHRGMGQNPPEFGVGDANANCPPPDFDFCHRYKKERCGQFKTGLGLGLVVGLGWPLASLVYANAYRPSCPFRFYIFFHGFSHLESYSLELQLSRNQVLDFWVA